MDNLSPINIPDPSQEEQEVAIRSAVRMFRHEQENKRKTPLWCRWALPLGAAVAAYVVMLVVKLPHTIQPESFAAIDDKDTSRIAHEMQSIFGAQLAGVVMDVQGIEPVLMREGTNYGQQPVVITYPDGTQQVTVIGFSGITMTIPVAGRQLVITPLVTSSSDVILEGNDFVLPGSIKQGLPNVQARTLEDL
jgi:hypothetical protein